MKYLVPGLPSVKGPLSQSLSLAVEELLLPRDLAVVSTYELDGVY